MIDDVALKAFRESFKGTTVTPDEAAYDEAGRYAAMGFTDLVFHHPRADDPVWNEPEAIVETIATEGLPKLR